MVQFLQKDTLQLFCDLLLSRIYPRLGQKPPQVQILDFEADLFSGIHMVSHFTSAADGRSS